jgi:GxxExxY protein
MVFGSGEMSANSGTRMHAEKPGLIHEELTEKIIGIFFKVYNELGHGFLESVYEEAFCVSLAEQNIFYERQRAVPVFFHGLKIGDFRADILVDSKVMVELKAVAAIERVHEKQLTNYLKATEIEVGIILNFGPEPKFKRVVFENARKGIRNHPRDPREMNFENK